MTKRTLILGYGNVMALQVAAKAKGVTILRYRGDRDLTPRILADIDLNDCNRIEFEESLSVSAAKVNETIKWN